MTISTTFFRHGVAFAILSVLLTVSALAQTTTTPATTPATPTTTSQPDTAVLADPTAPPAGMPGTTPLGMLGTGYGAMPGMGMQPGAMGGMPMGMGMPQTDPRSGMPQPGMGGGMSPPMGYGGSMPLIGMGGMGMRQGGRGYDPEMNAMLAQQLQRLRIQETQLNSEIAMNGGEASLAAQQLLAQRTMLQNQIRDLEQQLGVSGAGTTGMPGLPSNPMTGMNPAMTQPGMVPPGMASGMMPNDMMAPGMARPGMPGVPGYGGYGSPMMGANPLLRTDPNRMFFEQQKQEITLELQRVQHQLSFVDANHPMRPILLAEQERLVAQRDSLDKQLGQTPAPGGALPGAAGSTARSLTDLTTPAVPAAPPARTNVAVSPEIRQMMDTEQRLRASGQIASADEMKAMIEKQQAGGFVEPLLPATTPVFPNPVLPPTMAMPSLSQQAELTELRSTVDSLRGEIASMRDEIRALNAMLRRWDQTSEYYPTSEQNGMFEMPPETPVYPEIPSTE